MSLSSSPSLVRCLALLVVPAAAVACSVAEEDPVDAVDQAQVSDASSMIQRPDGRFDVVCKDGRTEIVTAEQITQNRVCQGSGGGAGGSPGRVVIYGTSDSCDPNRVVASITSATNCNTLSDSERAWSIGVNGRCVDIDDTTVRRACLAHQPGRVVIFGSSDSCDTNRVVASASAETDCNTLSDSERAWSVRVDGQCIDIDDTTVRRACLAYQPGRTIIYGTSDSCDPNRIVASVGRDTDCNTLSDSERAWSVRVNGQCIDIDDTTVRRACRVHQP